MYIWDQETAFMGLLFWAGTSFKSGGKTHKALLGKARESLFFIFEMSCKRKLAAVSGRTVQLSSCSIMSCKTKAINLQSILTICDSAVRHICSVRTYAMVHNPFGFSSRR